METQWSFNPVRIGNKLGECVKYKIEVCKLNEVDRLNRASGPSYPPTIIDVSTFTDFVQYLQKKKKYIFLYI